MKSPFSRSSIPAWICSRRRSSFRASSRRRCWRARSASRMASLAFWYSPVRTMLSTNSSCSRVKLILRVGIVCSALRKPCIWQSLPTANRRGPPAESTSAEVAVEVDDFGVLLKAEHDAEIAGSAAAERDRFLDMIGDAGALGVGGDRDADREGPLAEDRLVGAGHRDKILQVD